jgi:hypothetical protein
MTTRHRTRTNARHRLAAGLAILLLLAARAAPAAEWIVAPGGTPGGDGTAESPWDLATAFQHPASVRPGDTIRLRGGTYRIEGPLRCALAGTAARPIVVRSARGERAVLDVGSAADNRVFAFGEHVWFRDFEYMSSGPDRWADENVRDIDRGTGIYVGNEERWPGPGTRFLNLVIHDTAGVAIGFYRYSADSEIYGCLLFHNGYDDEKRGHGHGVYAQNATGTPRRIVDNVIFNQFSHGIHIYGSRPLDNFHIEGNIIFNNGAPSRISGYTRCILIGGGRIAFGTVVMDNVCYYEPPPEGGMGLDIGYGEGTSGTVVLGNRFLVPAGRAIRYKPLGPVRIEGNVFLGATEIDRAAFPDNQWLEEPPAETEVIVRPNRIAPGRAHICVLNREEAAEVAVDLSAVPGLETGDAYEVYDVQNLLGEPVLRGTYNGAAVRLPMDLTEVMPVIGRPVEQPRHTDRRFNVFLLKPVATPDGEM